MRWSSALLAATLIVPSLFATPARGGMLSLAPIESGTYYHFLTTNGYDRSNTQSTAGLNLFGTFSENRAYFVFDLAGLDSISRLAFSFYVVDPSGRTNWSVDLSAGATGTEAATLMNPGSTSRIAQVFDGMDDSSYGSLTASRDFPRGYLFLTDQGVADANLARVGPGQFALTLTSNSGGPNLRSVQIIDPLLRVATADAEVTALPEPSGWVLIALGLAAAAHGRRWIDRSS